jgi:hypothetical protein
LQNTDLFLLHISDNEIINFETLKNLKNLKTLYCWDNPYLDEQIPDLQQHLPNCEIISHNPNYGLNFSSNP